MFAGNVLKSHANLQTWVFLNKTYHQQSQSKAVGAAVFPKKTLDSL